jgi:cell division protein FtsQ
MILARKRSGARNRRRENGNKSARIGLPGLRRLAPAALLVLAVAGGLLALRFALDLPVERVSVSGRFQRVQAPDVEKAVREAVAGRGMIAVDLADVAEAVERIAWVDRASVARSWPRALTVQVVEQTPVARWGAGGLLNQRGELFVHDTRYLPPELPEFAGPEGRQALMTEQYLAMAPQLEDAGMRLMRLWLDPRGAWELLLDNGVTLRLGRERVQERFERFLRAAARDVAARAAEIAYVDLRYANGFAVGWRPAGGEASRG